jgi:hypothetical protein
MKSSWQDVDCLEGEEIEEKVQRSTSDFCSVLSGEKRNSWRGAEELV